jgi:hypothetical protein
LGSIGLMGTLGRLSILLVSFESPLDKPGNLGNPGK